uniref:Death domain-containing protein n=1 Tax=Amphimedon queenslandica TaxID=400682 RepID=A0A1X7TSQ1_AMPQE
MSLEDKCWKVFKDEDHEEAIRLLPLVKEPNKIKRRYRWWDDTSLLHLSSRNGWLDVTKDLIIKYHCDPQERDSAGDTCLYYAAVYGHIDVMKYLIDEAHCGSTISTQYRSTVLHSVADKGALDFMKYLINHHHYNPMATTKDGETVLHCAARHIDIVKYLINECHCDPMAIDKYGNTVLHRVADKGSLIVMKYLINHHHCDPMATNNIGGTVLHSAAEHINMVKYLINECHCDPMAIDSNNEAILHLAALAVEYLLSTGKCDPLARDNDGCTPFKLAKEKGDTDTLSVFKKFGGIKSSHPIDSYVNVLLVGNPGAGKSTLSHVINDTASFTLLGSFRNVGGVVPCTAGIIPYKLKHKKLGNIILHDFAGHSEYYSSHSAVIENLLQGSGGVFLIVVNILEKEPVKQLHQWLTVVRNEAHKALNQCHVILIVSHVDEISNPIERRRRKEEIQEIIVMERCDSVFLDCRKLGGSGVDSFFNKLSSACESIRNTSGRNLSLYCHMMYGLLEERKENILTLSDLMSAAKDNDDYFIPDKREDVLDVLHSLHSTEHVDIASNTGIVSVSGLTRYIPKYDPGMLIRFLKNMELCQEINPSFLTMTNLHQLAVEEEEEGGTERRGERLLFFPCLLSTDRPDEMTSQVYQFGWCLQCTSKHHFFPPRYFHILSLRLAYKMALPQEDDKLNRYCKFWRNGLHWFDDNGVRVLVEIVDESQCVLVMMSCKKGYSDNMVSLRRNVIGEVMSAYKESCPSLEVKELVIDPKELAYPVNTLRERTTYGIYNVLLAIKKRKPFLVNNRVQTEMKEILPDESLSDISNLSLLGGRDIKEVIEITEEFKTPLAAVKLDIKDLDIVIKELTSDQHLPCSVWHRLGLQLGLYDPRLVDIDKKNRGDPVECFRECMSAWLRGEDKVIEKEGPSWSSLATALDTIEEKSIASYIRKKYCTAK